MRQNRLWRLPAGVLFALLAINGGAQAAQTVIYDLSTGTSSGAGTGNSYTIATEVNGVSDLQVFAFSDLTGTPNNLSAAEVMGPANFLGPAAGLGVCNAEDEFLGFLPCNFPFNGGQFPVDNDGQREWLLFFIPGLVNNQWQEIVFEDQGADMDVSFWVLDGINAPGDIDGDPYSSLGTRYDVNDPVNGVVSLNGLNGNALLVGASFNNIDGQPDRLIATSVTTEVPLPPAFYLFGSAIAFLANRSRKRAAT